LFLSSILFTCFPQTILIPLFQSYCRTTFFPARSQSDVCGALIEFPHSDTVRAKRSSFGLSILPAPGGSPGVRCAGAPVTSFRVRHSSAVTSSRHRMSSVYRTTGRFKCNFASESPPCSCHAHRHPHATVLCKDAFRFRPFHYFKAVACHSSDFATE